MPKPSPKRPREYKRGPYRSYGKKLALPLSARRQLKLPYQAQIFVSAEASATPNTVRKFFDGFEVEYDVAARILRSLYGLNHLKDDVLRRHELLELARGDGADEATA